MNWKVHNHAHLSRVDVSDPEPLTLKRSSTSPKSATGKDGQLTQKSHTDIVYSLVPRLLTPLQVTNTRVGDSLEPRLFFLDLSLSVSLPSLEKN